MDQFIDKDNIKMLPEASFLILAGFIAVVLVHIYRKAIYKFFKASEDGEHGVEVEPLLQKQTNSSLLTMKDIQWSNLLTIFVNGNAIQLTNPDPTELLATFIREKIGLKGTKLGCEEGGCGACTVVLTKPQGIVSVNSCLRPLCANDGMAVTTVEGIGSVKDELSPEQKRLVGNNGTQCGFCTPGWITNMHALNQSNELAGTSSTKREIDAYLDGNLCRCTGYRPILHAFQSFADESPSGGCCSAKADSTNSISAGEKKHPCVEFNCSAERQQACVSRGHDIDNCCGDVEDASCATKSACTTKVGPGTVSRPLGKRRAERDLALVLAYIPQPLLFFNPVSGQRWIRPVSLTQLCAVLREVAPTAAQAQYVQLVGGNTSIGVTKYLNGSGPYNTADKYSTFIDVNQVQEMVTQDYNAATGELTVGAATSIATLIQLLEKYAPPIVASAQTSASEGVHASESATGHVINHHSAFSVTANHLSKIANTQVSRVQFILLPIYHKSSPWKRSRSKYFSVVFHLPQVRNAGSWAGNLMMFLRYPTFPSDAVLALTTANAQLHLCNRYGEVSIMEMQTFLSQTLEFFQAQGLMLTSLTIRDTPLTAARRSTFSAGPAAYSQQVAPGRSVFITETFKVAQRARNAHAHVNAGFQFEIDAPRVTQGSAGPPTCRTARVVYGGVSNKTFVAHRCQNALLNAPLTSATLSRALAALQLDLVAVGASQEVLGDQRFRESVMQAFLYRALLRCYSTFSLPSSLTSAVTPWVMPVSRGVELFMPPNPSQNATSPPVALPVRKLEGKIQATGEAKYPSDEAMSAQGLYGAIVFSTQCAKKLVSMDVSAALALPGVVRSFLFLHFL